MSDVYAAVNSCVFIGVKMNGKGIKGPTCM